MVTTNEEYKPGDVFYVYEIRDGWARVYSASNNGFVWYERLIVKDIYKTSGGSKLANKPNKQIVNQKNKLNETKGLKVGGIPPKTMKNHLKLNLEQELTITEPL